MADSTKKRRSGRRTSNDEQPATSSKKTKKTGDATASHAAAQTELHSPWGPLMWMLIPLIVCVIYAVLTRVF